MKKFIVISFIVLIIGISFTSCSTTTRTKDVIKEPTLAYTNKPIVLGKYGIPRPDWVITQSIGDETKLYGVGFAKYSDENEARKLARVEAKNSLAEGIYVVIQEIIKSYNSELGKTYEIISSQTAKAYLSEARYTDEWISEDGTVFVLIEIPIENVLDQFAMNIDKNFNRETIINLQEKMSKALQENNM